MPLSQTHCAASRATFGRPSVRGQEPERRAWCHDPHQREGLLAIQAAGKTFEGSASRPQKLWSFLRLSLVAQEYAPASTCRRRSQTRG
eukprot:1558444-Rhodomonas_salina.2